MQVVGHTGLVQPVPGLRDYLQLVHLIPNQCLAGHIRQETVLVAVRLELQQFLVGLQAKRPIDPKQLGEKGLDELIGVLRIELTCSGAQN